jgi:hypothetical protein
MGNKDYKQMHAGMAGERRNYGNRGISLHRHVGTSQGRVETGSNKLKQGARR